MENSRLVEQSQHEVDGGGLCGAVAYEVRKSVIVYRASAASRDKGPDFYNWWSLENPSGLASQYRKDNVMCNEWGVEMKTACKLRVGSKTAVGFGQSYAQCTGGQTLGASSRLQVYLSGTPADIEAQVEDCRVEPSLLQP